VRLSFFIVRQKFSAGIGHVPKSAGAPDDVLASFDPMA